MWADVLDAGPGRDLVVLLTVAARVTCGAGFDRVRVAASDFAKNVDRATCESVEVFRATGDRELDLLAAATNRGRRLGGEVAVGRATPLSVGFNKARGTEGPDRLLARSIGKTSYLEPIWEPLPGGGRRALALTPAPYGLLTERDLLLGRGGDDLIEGDGGDDHLEGEAGDDVLRGGAGADDLYGRTGADHLNGGAGHDALEGGRGRDRLDGGSGNDELNGGIDPDRLRGGEGRDRLVSVGGGTDRVDCGPGRDVAIVDSRDRVQACETVLRGRR